MTKFDINNDQRLKQFIGESELEMPFDDFEDKVMHSIEETVSKKVRIKKMISRSWLFYILGLGLGIFTPNLIKFYEFPEKVNVGIVVLAFQVGFAIAALFFLEKLIRISLKK